MYLVLAVVGAGPSAAASVGAAPVGAGSVSAAPIVRTTAAAVTGSFGIRIVPQPGDDRSDPRSSYYIVATVKPGTVVHRRLEISNHTSASGFFVAYAAGAGLSNGQFLGAPGRTPNQLSSWTTVTPSALSLRPGACTAINVTITVPRIATPGIRYGVVWAQLQGGLGAGISSASRVGIRMYLTVPTHS